MDFLQLSYFVEVAEQLSFTKAAAKLSVSQPALSRQISGLENEFGIKLFARSATGISLTEEGRFALDQARDLLYHYRIMSDTMTGIGSKGKHLLALGCSTMLDSIHGSNIFTSYLDAQDHQIKCYEGTTRSLIMMTAILNIDFSVCIRYDHMIYDHMNEIDLTPFSRGRLCAVIRKDALAGVPSFSDLPRQQTLIASLEFEPFINRSGQDFESVLFTDNLHTMKTEILDNDCIGLIPDIALPFFDEDVRCLEMDKDKFYECCFVSRRGAKLPKDLLAFQKVFSEMIEKIRMEIQNA
jgi:DNA-binding transcriptional LysR family regulator